MTDLAYAALFVVATWWLSTAFVLRLVWLKTTHHRGLLSVAGVLALVAFYGLVRSSLEATVENAYLGFGCALVVWGWHELSFLLGVVTGPRREPCPSEARGWRRFRVATEVVIHHELALAATLAALWGLTWGAPNPTGTWTFLVLWSMRLSAKLNIFLGVRNIAEEFVPNHLAYLVSYFRKAPFNPLMPFSLVGGGAVAALLIERGISASATSFDAVSHGLVGTILVLALIEHVFLTLRLPDALLFRWVLGSKPRPESPMRLRPLRKILEAPSGNVHDEG